MRSDSAARLPTFIPSRAATTFGNSARACRTSLAMQRSSWAGSWWNSASCRTPAARATRHASLMVEWPQPLRQGPQAPAYSSSVYWAS